MNIIFIFLVTVGAVWSQCTNIDYVHTWIANTYATDSWVNYNATGFYVTRDGYVVTNTPWDEGGREVGIYKDGVAVSLVEYTHGWGRSGGYSVTSDGTYVYFGTTQSDDKGNHGTWPPAQWPFPPNGTMWFMVRRTFLNGTTAYYEGSSSFIGISTDPTRNVSGLAVSMDGGILYVSRTSVIEVYNATNRDLLDTWEADNAGQLAVDLKGNVWVAPVGPGKGNNLGVKVPIAKATGIAVHRVTGQLMVIDQSLAARSVSIYDISGGTPVLTGSFGQSVFSEPNPGLYADDRFNNLVGVGSDAQGNVYVGMSEMGCDIRAFSPSGVLLWKVQGLEWLSTAHYSPSDDLIYGPVSKYSFKPNSIGNGTEWALYSSTMDLLSYPWDPRADIMLRAGSTRVYNFGGQKFMSVTNMYIIGFVLYRFEGEKAIPCAAFTRQGNVWDLPNFPVNVTGFTSYIWTDVNGNGYPETEEYQIINLSYTVSWTHAWAISVDVNGTIWTVDLNNNVAAYYYNSLNSFGVPMWSNSSRYWGGPYSSLEAQRIFYVPEEDTLYISGTTIENNYNTATFWGMSGTSIQKYLNWTSISNTSAANPDAEYLLPSVNNTPTIKSFDIYQNVFFGAHFRTGQIFLIDLRNGTQLAVLDPIFNQGWIDMPYSITVSRRLKTGEWIIIVEEDYHNKNTVYVVPDQSCLPPLPPL